MARSRNLVASAVLAASLGVASTLAHADSGSYAVTYLVSDGSVPAAHVDPNLVNGWGVAFNPNAVVWLSDNGTGKSTLYDGTGTPQSLVVDIPSPTGPTGGTPTGIVFNGSSDFKVTNGTTSGPAAFIFATEDGIIAGWNPTVDGTHALPAVQKAGAVYKGIALIGNGEANHLYAADLVGGRIDVYDRTFQPVSVPGGFVDPKLPAGFSPFNIMALGGNLYVAYAFHVGSDHDETAGPGLGIVDVFDADGYLIRRVGTRGQLNAPWGMALAPASFGRFGNSLIVGNFGDGTINAYDPHTGSYQGQLRGADGKPLQIDGLWGLAFGNGVRGQPTDSLYFAAGPNDENNGAYGVIDAMPGTGNPTSGD